MKKIQIIWEHPSRPPEVGEDDLERILTVFLDKLGLGGHGVTLLVADDQTLAGLNRDHRGVAGPTDILSWGYLDPAAPEEQPQNDPTMDEVGPLLGEMAVSLDAAIRQAGENRWDLRTELFSCWPMAARIWPVTTTRPRSRND